VFVLKIFFKALVHILRIACHIWLQNIYGAIRTTRLLVLQHPCMSQVLLFTTAESLQKMWSTL